MSSYELVHHAGLVVLVDLVHSGTAIDRHAGISRRSCSSQNVALRLVTRIE